LLDYITRLRPASRAGPFKEDMYNKSCAIHFNLSKKLGIMFFQVWQHAALADSDCGFQIPFLGVGDIAVLVCRCSLAK
jgi:hypothetical protein